MGYFFRQEFSEVLEIFSSHGLLRPQKSNLLSDVFSSLTASDESNENIYLSKTPLYVCYFIQLIFYLPFRFGCVQVFIFKMINEKKIPPQCSSPHQCKHAKCQIQLTADDAIFLNTGFLWVLFRLQLLHTLPPSQQQPSPQQQQQPSLLQPPPTQPQL